MRGDVPVLALGSWHTWDRMEFDEVVAVIARAAELGCAFFDVAHYDMGPHAEGSRTDLIFGQAVRAAGLTREDWLYCGKLWLWDYPRTGFDRQMTTSLERVGVERADMVVVGDYAGALEVERVVVDVAEQVEAGRFASWGVNNWRIGDVRAAIDIARRHGLPPPSFAQLKYGLVRRSVAEGECYAPLFASGELALQASDVLEGGLLAGNLRPGRKIGADVGGIRGRIIDAWPQVAHIAGDLGVSAAQLGIAFCLTNPATANVLVGVSSLAQLEDDLAAIELVDRVGADTLRELTDALWLDREVAADGSW
ncbi:aldo/keto reductase [Fodinicola acaciae]|uniref:aldo/keto reductase n=1 Tax=Fodinicola acaciae TaxID=2681555 RepID=UPI0013CFF684|nr:aldo/keto reductase [Fodinicola acaciae]